MTRKITIEQKWLQQSEVAKSEAEKLPHGKERGSREKGTAAENCLSNQSMAFIPRI